MSHFFGINLNRISEIGQIKLANALRKFLNFGKKLTVIGFKQMNNGCLWLCYVIDGVKCSTFIAAADLQNLLAGVASSAVIPYIEAVVNAYFKKDLSLGANQDSFGGSLTVRVANPKSFANVVYRINWSEQHQSWVACLPRSGNAVMKHETLKTLLANIVKVSTNV